MKLLKTLSVLVALGGLAALLIVVAPSVYGQRGDDRWSGPPDGRARTLTMLAGRGAEIGVSVRDLGTGDKPPTGGVVVEEVRPDSPAEKAGLKPSDVLVEFDGEHVRSARQFSRLVQETAPGRSVKATVLRDGQRREVQLTPTDGRDSLFIDSDRLRERFGDLGRRLDQLPGFNFDFSPFQGESRGRLGVSVEELTPQLAEYFGAKEGVLVAAVTDDSPAAHAGLKAADVITKVNDEPVRSRADLVRSLRDLPDDGQVTIAIVRDKKASTVTAKLETRRVRRGRPA